MYGGAGDFLAERLSVVVAAAAAVVAAAVREEYNVCRRLVDTKITLRSRLWPYRELSPSTIFLQYWIADFQFWSAEQQRSRQ